MSKAILISIQPKWCELMASGKKTVEVRKTRPKLQPPFKCYIYCTKAKEHFSFGGGLYATADTLYRLPTGEIKFGDGFELMGDWSRQYDENNFLNGKIIGEFVCNAILSHCEMANADIAEVQGCIKRETLYEYSGGKELYGWHISDLVIYDKPKELKMFFSACNKPVGTDCSKCVDERQQSCRALKRAPQSWCYVEDMA